MEYGEKKPERFWLPKQLGVESTLAHEIRATAAADRRGIREQIGYLIELGLSHRAALLSNEHRSESLHSPAHFGIPRKPLQHATAQGGTQVHTSARRIRA